MEIWVKGLYPNTNSNNSGNCQCASKDHFNDTDNTFDTSIRCLDIALVR